MISGRFSFIVGAAGGREGERKKENYTSEGLSGYLAALSRALLSHIKINKINFMV